MTTRNDGKASETKVQEALVLLQSKSKLFFMRLYDSTSAQGSFIPAQISDYFVTYKGLSVSLEVKSSSIHDSMKKVPRSYLRDTQVAKLRLLLRAGGQGLFVFQCVKKGVTGWEIWDGRDVVEWHLKNNKKIGEPLCSFESKDLATELKKVLEFYVED